MSSRRRRRRRGCWWRTRTAQVWPCPEKLWPGQPGAYTHWSFNPRGLSDLLERIENERVEMERLPVEACEPWGELLDPREFLEIIDKR